MRDKELKRYLRQCLQQEAGYGERHDEENAGLEETIRLCAGIVREQSLMLKPQEEPRIGFVRYLSYIFRFEGAAIFGLQTVTLFFICLAIYAAAGDPSYIPAFMPLFVLVVMPAMFKCQHYGMSEIEAVTRASGPQIILAKLILAGFANLIGMTFFIIFELRFQNLCGGIGQILLYCMVPYLVCMICMLRLFRSCRRENIQICAIVLLSSCLCWGLLARTQPWLYETSAFGIWLIAFFFSAAFFIKEVYFIISMRKEGKVYGIIA